MIQKLKKAQRLNIIENLTRSYKVSSTLPKMHQDTRKRNNKSRTFAPPDNSDELDRLKKLTEASLTPLREDKYIEENTSFSDKQVLKKINPKYMAEMIDNEEKYKRNKTFYEDESNREHARINFF